MWFKASHSWTVEHHFCKTLAHAAHNKTSIKSMESKNAFRSIKGIVNWKWCQQKYKRA